jgi:hypothetical protein
MAKSRGQSAAGASGEPSAEAREALAMWGLALRYVAGAARPVAQGATQRVKERLAAVTSSESSVKDRLDPSKTEKGGKVGDAADALLGKMGKPGKLAAKASLGSRVVGRLTPDLDDEAPDSEAEEEERAEEPEATAAESEETVDEPDASEPEEDEPETTAESEPSGSDAGDEDEDEEAEEDEQAEAGAEDDTAEDSAKAVKPQSEPVRAHPGADPLHTDFDHAYSDEVENYEHQDAYAPTR